MAGTDLISREDAINLVKHRMKHNPMKSVQFIQGLQDAYLRVVSDLNRLPSAEPKIIRCKDCEYFRTPKDENNYCDHDFAGIRHVPFDDDYCSYAERKII